MGVMEERAKIRKENILRQLQKNPDTMKGVAEELGLNYHTVRLDMLALHTEGAIHTIATRKSDSDRSIMYKALKAADIPEIFLQAQKRAMPITMIADSYTTRNFAMPGTANSIISYFEILVEMLETIRAFNDPTSGLSEKDAIVAAGALRKSLNEVKKYVSSFDNMIDQTLNAKMWTVEDFTIIAQSPNFKPNHIREQYEALLRYKDSIANPDSSS